VREGETDRERVLRREIDFAKESISVAPNSASSWNYLRGILQKTGTPFRTLETFVEPYTLPQPRPKQDTASAPASPEMIDLENPAPSSTASLPCSLAIEFLADIYLEKAAELEGEARDAFVKQAVELFGLLASKQDTIRKKYWEYRQQRAQQSPVAA